MKYKDFLKFSTNNIYRILLSFDGEYLEFKVNSDIELRNIRTLKWDKVNFTHFKQHKIYKVYKTTKNNT